MTEDKRLNIEQIHVPDGFTVHDISIETERGYIYPDPIGGELVIVEPWLLFMKQDEDGYSHRVVTKNGHVYYPQRGWMALRWVNSIPTRPVEF